MVVNSCLSYDVLFRSCLGNSRCRAENSISKATIYCNVNKMTQSVTSTKPPPRCRPPFYLVMDEVKVSEPKSFFELAENCEASSLWVGAHRYTRVLCASKLLWVYSNLNSDFFSVEKLLKPI